MLSVFKSLIKSSGRYKVVKSIGSSSNNLKITELVTEAEIWIKNHCGLIEIDFSQADVLLEQLVGSIQQIKIVGIELLLGKLFTDIGFSLIKDDLFKKLVLSRLCYPVSKLKTVDYLRRYEGFETNETAIYRYLHKLNASQKNTVQNISYQHTLKVLNNTLQLVFFAEKLLQKNIKKQQCKNTRKIKAPKNFTVRGFLI